jgi:predicted DNA-binding transcriptional regulator YafY
LVSLLLLLDSRNRITADALAAELGVTVRTVYRDVQALIEAGIPVYAEPGHGGGYSLVGGYRTRLTNLTVEEAQALLAASVPGPAAQLGFGSALSTAGLKLLAGLPADLRSRASHTRDRFHLDAPAWYRQPEDPPHLATIAKAVLADRRAALIYRHPDRVVRRLVDPLGLVLKAGTWYLVACHRRRPRTYRLSRIRSVALCDDAAHRPDGFDLATYWAASTADYENSHGKVPVRARIARASLDALAYVIEPAAMAAALSTTDADENGRLTLTIPADSLEFAYADLIRLGPKIEILAPAELRQRFADTGAALATLYGVH